MLTALAILAAPAVRVASAPLDLPVRRLGTTEATSPAYLGNVVSIRLTPPAARQAHARARAARVSALGVAGVDNALRALGATVEPEFLGETSPPEGSASTDYTAFYLVRLGPGVPLEAALERLRAAGEIASASPIPVAPAMAAAPNDSLWAISWWFHQASRRDIHVLEAWDVTRGDPSVAVAILDTGVLPYHPDLTGPGRELLFSNDAEVSGLPGIDDDGNGFVDDVAGWDFVDVEEVVTAHEDGRDPDPDPNDYVGHGTAVAGVAAALTDNAIGIAGTAPEARILPLRIGWSEPAIQTGVIGMHYAAQAVRYATRMGASVINMSFSIRPLLELEHAVTDAIASGVVVVVAAGNLGSPTGLTSIPGVIYVTATDRNDVVPSWANLASYVDLAAPGADLATTVLRRVSSDSLGMRVPHYVSSVNGTSFAAPIVSGAVALMQSRRRELGLRPLRSEHAEFLLRNTADDISAANPSGGYGAGRLNAARAIEEAEWLRWAPIGSASRGPGVILPASAGVWIAVVTVNGHVNVLEGGTLRNVATRSLPAIPTSGLAAADLGHGLGIGMFVTLQDGRVHGMDALGEPLPGWPVAFGPGRQASSPALGDLDGDGELEVVCTTLTGAVWAWSAHGVLLPGFPVQATSEGFGGPVALADLDGNSGVEILVADGDGVVHAFDHRGARVSGWPTASGQDGLPSAPVVATQGGETRVVVAGQRMVRAFSREGVERMRVSPEPLPAPPYDPAIADLDQDGDLDLVVASSGTLQSFDPAGAPAPRHGLTQTIAGPPVVAKPDGGAAPVIVAATRSGSHLTPSLYDATCAEIDHPPIVGSGSTHPSLAWLSGRALDVLTGSGAEGSFQVISPFAPAAATELAWPTARGNDARTGSTLYQPPPGEVGPATIKDLRVESVRQDALQLAWTASGEDGLIGRPEVTHVRFSAEPPDRVPIDQWAERACSPTVDAGETQRFTLDGLRRATRYWIAIQAVDHGGNASRHSPVLDSRTEVGGPLGSGGGAALAVGRQPATPPVSLYWRVATAGPPASGVIRVHDAAGRVRRSLQTSGESPGYVLWDGRDDRGVSVGPGLYFPVLEAAGARATARIVLLSR